MTIYILCPPNFFTGGPLGLHQLCKELNDAAVQSFIYYPRNLMNRNKFPVHENYVHFDNPFVRTVPDDPENVLIVPEIFTEHFYGFKNIKKVVWWLSVNNYFVYNDAFNKSFLGRFKRFVGRSPLSIEKFNESVHMNLGQSEYSMNFAAKASLNNPVLLNDFIPRSFFQNVTSNIKENVVLYNPKKGVDFTNKLIARNSDIKFIPIINLKPHEVVDLLKRSKLYIDFGEHPGRDRFPREAAVLGNVIITGKDGSAGNEVDINIQDEYKFDKNDTNLALISGMIQDIFKDYSMHLENQRAYRSKVGQGESIFKGHVNELIEKLKILV